MEKKHVVKLNTQERKHLLGVIRKGKNKAAVIQRAHILLKSDEGKTDCEISQWLYISEQTVRRTRLRYSQMGLGAALEDKARPATEAHLDDRQVAYLIALTCSNPPPGRARWTLALLAKQLVRDGIVERISLETVRLILKKTGSSPGA